MIYSHNVVVGYLQMIGSTNKVHGGTTKGIHVLFKDGRLFVGVD